jgi:hypothetical protein
MDEHEDRLSRTTIVVRQSDSVLDLIRFGGHLPKGGYDVPTDGRHTEAAPPASPVHR